MKTKYVRFYRMAKSVTFVPFKSILGFVQSFLSMANYNLNDINLNYLAAAHDLHNALLFEFFKPSINVNNYIDYSNKETKRTKVYAAEKLDNIYVNKLI